jgi:4-hydroxy-4-methyl-2-oxoglutarate aldolase
MTAALEAFRKTRQRKLEQRRKLTKGELDGFREYSCTLCVGDVLHGLGLNCITQGLHPVAVDMQICGPALTKRLIASRNTEGWHEDEFAVPDFIDVAEPGDVLVIDIGGRMDAGPWGSNVTAMAKVKGLGGTVVDGVCRDTNEIVAIGYPVFSRGRAVRHGHGVYYSTSVISEPVQIGTRSSAPIMVAPGDLVIANVDGLCVVPVESAAEVLKLYRERHEIDVEKHEALLAGQSFAELSKTLGARTRALEGLGASPKAESRPKG